MTADNTYFTTTGKSITLAWFRGPEYQADKLPPYTQSCIMESEVYRTIVFWNVPIWHQRTGVPYHFRWVIFPYRYDEVISYKGQSMTVQNAIKKMAVDFAANPALQRYHDRTSGADLIATFPASSNFSFVSTLGYLSRANVADTVPLYSCRNGLTDTFYRTDPAACLNFPVIRPEGYLYTRSAAGRLPLYSCFNALGHIATTRVDCEGRKMEGLLGWVRTHP
jgi:hypothetical protein